MAAPEAPCAQLMRVLYLWQWGRHNYGGKWDGAVNAYFVRYLYTHSHPVAHRYVYGLEETNHGYEWDNAVHMTIIQYVYSPTVEIDVSFYC